MPDLRGKVGRCHLGQGKAQAVYGFATLTNAAGTSSAFYSINLLNGEATRIGQPHPLLVTDIALPLDTM